MGAGKQVIKLLEYGFVPKFRQTIKDSYHEPNNRSALNDSEFVREKLDSWVAKGIVTKVEQPPFCRNPLTVSSKYSASEGKVKKRLCLDLSRKVNPALWDIHTKMDDLNSIRAMIPEAGYMTSSDLRDMYHHMKLNSKFTKFFGFEFPDKNGITQYYEYLCLTYGTKIASQLFQLVTNEVKRFFSSLNLWLVIYIDDQLSGDRDTLVSKITSLFYHYVIQCCGFSINREKSQTTPTKSIIYLGFVLDTENMRYVCPDYKIKYIKQRIDELKNKYQCNVKVTAKEFAQILGLINSIAPSHGNFTKICARSAHTLLGKTVLEGNWESSCYVTQEVMVELGLFLKYLDRFNGNPIKTVTKTYTTVYPESVDIVRKHVDPHEYDRQWKIFCSDASESSAYVFEVDKNSFAAIYEHSPEEKITSSSFRELLSIIKTIEHHPHIFQSKEPKNILWLSDSQVLRQWTQVGSRIKIVQKLLIQIFEFRCKNNFT